MHRRCARMTSVGRPDARVSVLFLSLSNIFEIRKKIILQKIIQLFTKYIFYLFLESIIRTVLRIIFEFMFYKQTVSNFSQLHNILLKMKSPKYTSFSTKLYLYINARLRLRIKNKCFRVV